MLTTRVIPILLLRGRGLVKTVRFRDAMYVGDPVNAVRIFNEKEVDELALLDIDASVEGREPPFETIAEVAGECFMPLSYGGGIRSLPAIERILSLGVEKVIINSATISTPDLVKNASEAFGSQSIAVSIDAKRTLAGRYEVFTQGGRINTRLSPVECARRVEDDGAGEILVTSIDRDGTREGYDLELTRSVSAAVGIPVVAAGGAGRVEDLAKVVMEGGASAAAAGSLFVLQGKHRAVLISYPDRAVLEQQFGTKKN